MGRKKGDPVLKATGWSIKEIKRRRKVLHPIWERSYIWELEKGGQLGWGGVEAGQALNIVLQPSPAKPTVCPPEMRKHLQTRDAVLRIRIHFLPILIRTDLSSRIPIRIYHDGSGLSPGRKNL